MSIPVYFINLERRKDRLDHILRELHYQGINGDSVTRVNAVDGQTLEWNSDKYGPETRYWNRGALAYCFSWREIIRSAIRNGHKEIMVLDDDCHFVRRLSELELPEGGWAMVYLGANHNTTYGGSPTPSPYKGFSTLNGSLSSHAIILRERVYPALMDFLIDPYIPFDCYLSALQKGLKGEFLLTDPQFAVQDSLGSDIDLAKFGDWI